jgi:hypothetical protein
VPAEHDHADGKGRREQQSNRSPKGRPEHGGDGDRQRREAGARAIKPGFEHVAGQQLDPDEQGYGQQRRGPAGIDREGKRDREYRRQDRAEIGDETQEGGEDTPEQGVEHADEEQANADGQAIADVDHELHQQVAADPLGGIADRRRGAVYVAKAEQADHPIA